MRSFDSDLCCHLRLVVFFWKKTRVFEGFVCDVAEPRFHHQFESKTHWGRTPNLAPANHNNVVLKYIKTYESQKILWNSENLESLDFGQADVNMQ